MNSHKAILIIYTGGTIGMIKDHRNKALVPVNFDQIRSEVPELNKFDFKLDTIAFDPPLDSSDIDPNFWIRIAKIIFENYHKYTGFVVLHGTDTMSFSASGVSFLMENLNKPVIFTGAQLPIGTLRTDGKENLITSIEIAASQENNQPLVPEVCIYFENKLFRANRTTKFSAEHFSAFISANYPALANVGINISYNISSINYPTKDKELRISEKLDNNVGILRIYPGITPEIVNAICNTKNLKALILETYGSGNAITKKWFLDKLEELISRKIIILNVTQCQAGSVNMAKYETGIKLLEMGVVSGFDITIESALTKVMYLLAKEKSYDNIKYGLQKSLRGEINAI